MNFTSPMTLESFGESNNISSVSKSIFPYEFWENMEDVMRCTKFPSLMAFKSSLTRSGGEKWMTELLEICNELSDVSLNDTENWERVSKYFQISISKLKGFLELQNGQFIVKKERPQGFDLPTSPLKYKFSKEFFDKNCLTMLDYLRHVLIKIRVC